VQLHPGREGGVDRRHPRPRRAEGRRARQPPRRDRLPRPALRRRPARGPAEVDVFLGTGDLLRIAEAVEAPPAPGPVVYRGAQHVLPERELRSRVRTGAWWTAYVKVSEGCDHTCSFCIIPKIRGRHESRALDDVLAEASGLAADGVLELNLIAQDLTAYGRDRRDGTSLAVLLRALATRVPTLRWIRLLYAYPSSVTDELLEVMAGEPAVCRYLDMPLQHISDRMLRAMRRERSGAAVRALLARIRAAVPGIALRSSFIVGFPGRPRRTSTSSAPSSTRPSSTTWASSPTRARRGRPRPSWPTTCPSV
jgi:MiaB/RimO family radical SAM methylthiotransferase